MSDEHDGYNLILAFDSDDPEFRRGFEAALVYRDAWELERGTEFERQIHANNAEMVMRIAEATGCTFSAQEAEGDWVSVTVVKERGDTE